MSKVKIFKIDHSKFGKDYSPTIGTLEELTNDFGYTLEVGQSWQHEKGNKKINRKPKSIAALVTNIQNAKSNAASNGFSGSSFSVGVLTQEEIDTYWAEKKVG